jgi:DeoR/GlpR family transcriptional regulator of sugar metabolism
MINIHEAIYALNLTVVTIRGDIAYDADENIVEYDMAQAEAKLAEMQAEETAKQEAQVSAKQSAIAKLSALGLTEDEVKSLLGQ